MITGNELLLAGIVAGAVLAWRVTIATERIRTARHRYSQPTPNNPRAEGPQHAQPKRRAPGRVQVTDHWPPVKAPKDVSESQLPPGRVQVPGIGAVAMDPGIPIMSVATPPSQPADLPASQVLHRTEPSPPPGIFAPVPVQADYQPPIQNDPMRDVLAEAGPQGGLTPKRGGISYRSPFKEPGHHGRHEELRTEGGDGADYRRLFDESATGHVSGYYDKLSASTDRPAEQPAGATPVEDNDVSNETTAHIERYGVQP